MRPWKLFNGTSNIQSGRCSFGHGKIVFTPRIQRPRCELRCYRHRIVRFGRFSTRMSCSSSPQIPPRALFHILPTQVMPYAEKVKKNERRGRRTHNNEIQHIHVASRLPHNIIDRYGFSMGSRECRLAPVWFQNYDKKHFLIRPKIYPKPQPYPHIAAAANKELTIARRPLSRSSGR